MADGTYERRGPREAELARWTRLMAEMRSTSSCSPTNAEKCSSVALAPAAASFYPEKENEESLKQ